MNALQLSRGTRIGFLFAAILALLGLVMTMIVIKSPGVAALDNQPSAKVTAKVADVTLIDNSTGSDWETILSNTIKTSNQKDLFVDVSVECGLYTQTLVKSSGGTKDTSVARATVVVQVLVDDVPAYPGVVVFCDREQTLSATLGGFFQDDVLTAEEIELILKTMNANGFNFILDDLGPGVHLVEVQAKISTATSATNGSASAWGAVGKGSVTVESVRMIQGEDVLLD